MGVALPLPENLPQSHSPLTMRPGSGTPALGTPAGWDSGLDFGGRRWYNGGKFPTPMARGGSAVWILCRSCGRLTTTGPWLRAPSCWRTRKGRATLTRCSRRSTSTATRTRRLLMLGGCSLSLGGSGSRSRHDRRLAGCRAVERAVLMWPFRRTPVTSVQVLELRPTDRVILECSDRVSTAVAGTIRNALASRLDIHESRILVISNATLRVVREADPPPPPVIMSPQGWV